MTDCIITSVFVFVTLADFEPSSYGGINRKMMDAPLFQAKNEPPAPGTDLGGGKRRVGGVGGNRKFQFYCEVSEVTAGTGLRERHSPTCSP